MSQIVEWSGSFAMIETPMWWDAELARLWPEQGKGETDEFSVGRSNFELVQGYRLLEGRGWLVSMSDGFSFAQLVLCRTDAAFMDLMTTRAAVWAALPMWSRPAAESLEHIRNAVIAIARWGANNRDVSLFEGTDRNDQRKPEGAEY